jgi:hypothetical protein
MTTQMNPQTKATLETLQDVLEDFFDDLFVERFEFPEGFLDCCTDLKMMLIKLV